MSQPLPDQRSEVDPLLAFSIEHGIVATPAQPTEAIAPPVVAVTPDDTAPLEEIHALRRRIGDLEDALAQTVDRVGQLRTDVATLVGLTANIEKRLRWRASARRSLARFRLRRVQRRAAAVAGIIIGVATGAWLWTSVQRAVLARPSPIIDSSPATSAAAAPEPQAIQQASAPVDPGAIAPATVVQPAANRVTYFGTLSIEADPPGEVFIDRRRVGRTPFRAIRLKAGSHLVWIERDGYRRFTRVVTVPSDRVTRLVADLEPITTP